MRVEKLTICIKKVKKNKKQTQNQTSFLFSGNHAKKPNQNPPTFIKHITTRGLYKAELPFNLIFTNGCNRFKPNGKQINKLLFFLPHRDFY